MSENVTIALIVALTVVIVLLIFRKRLRGFKLKAGGEGVEAELEVADKAADSGDASVAQPASTAGVSIRGNKQIGRRNVIDVRRRDVEIADNLQAGSNNRLESKLKR